MKKKFNRKGLRAGEFYCEECGKKHFQVIIKDNLWNLVHNISGKDILCKDCIEKFLKRKLSLFDLKYLNKEETIIIPANFKLCRSLLDRSFHKRKLRYFYNYIEFKNRYKKGSLYLNYPTYLYLRLDYEKQFNKNLKKVIEINNKIKSRNWRK